jgi:hypothetical protein
MARRSGLWCDEAQFLWIVRMPSVAALLDFLWHHESHPPLFYLLMRIWLGIFRDSQAAALALPIMLGSALIPVSCWVGKRVFCNSTGLIAATFVAVSPELARYAGMVRPYSLLPLLCLLSTYWLWDGLSGRRVWPWAAHAMATLAMLLTHNWAWIALAAQWLVVACWFALRRNRPTVSLLLRWVIAQFALLMAYSPWLPVLVYQSRHAGYDAFPIDPLGVFAGFAELVVSLPAPVSVPVCMLLVVAAAWHAARRRTWLLSSGLTLRLSVLLFIGMPIAAYGLAAVVSIKKFLLFPQCMTTIIPCLLIAIAYGVASLSSMPRLVTLVFTSIYLFFSLDELRDIKSNAREAAAVVAARAQPTDLIVVTPVWLASPFNYYYSLGNPQMNYPHEERRGAIDYNDLRARLLDPRSMAMARQRLVQARHEGRRVWLVTESGDPKSDAPESDQLPPKLEFPAFAQVCRVRSAQLRRQLDALYGVPKSMAVPISGRPGLEVFQVLLYTQDENSSPTGRGSVPTGRPKARAEASRRSDHRGRWDGVSPAVIIYPAMAFWRN